LNGYTYIVPITAQTGVLDADYSYIPNASSLSYNIVEGQELPRLFIVMESLYTLTKKKTHYLID
jgi:hypothetical protein